MDGEQGSTLIIIIFSVVVAFMVFGLFSNAKERNAEAIRPAISSPPRPPNRATRSPPSEEEQRKARHKAMESVVMSLNNKLGQIDDLVRTRMYLDELELEGRRVLQDASLERVYQNAVMAHASRPPVEAPEVAPRVVNELVPEPALEIQPAVRRIQELEVPHVAVPGLDENSTNIDLWSLRQEDAGSLGGGWENSQPLEERVHNWQGTVRQGPLSDRHSAPPRLNPPRRDRVLW